ncbi:hypothetical protein [Lapillicoccus jejuensis]|uniref:Transcriptional regulator, AbiEi antitoxin, Type IV TA system n=1 Tax=Lapillicoccus jejuensis TaxID=402171 RepID=A0A542DVN6_9MICO|nr:hypothetical protein [Lapillicoccus jejuensis]TQJ07162.1 hypothetical protein FB458_0215 [Lapillicoccus jejuensis]
MSTPSCEIDVRQPFTRAEALKAGLTPYELGSTAFVRVFHGVYISREVPRTHVVRARAALKAVPYDDAVVSHESAAQLWGASVATSSVTITVRPKQVVLLPGVKARQRTARPPTSRRHGVLVTSPSQTFCDLGSVLDLVELVVVGDKLVRRKVVTPDQLVEAASQWRGWARGTVRRAAGLVRPGVDSPPETRLRLLVVLAGLPEPTVDYRIHDDDGTLLRRMELAYEEPKIAIEYQGRDHRRQDKIWVGDITRREELSRDSWRFVEVINEGLFDDPLETLLRIEQARVDRGCAPTKMFREEFRRYFPGKSVA